MFVHKMITFHRLNHYRILAYWLRARKHNTSGKMVRVWLYSEEKMPKFITLEELYKNSGVEYYQIDPNNYEKDPLLKSLMDKRGNHRVHVVENLDDNDLRHHIIEHFHEHDEFLLVLAGCGYFDTRDKRDEWLRVELMPGDLIVIPGGSCHRFQVENKETYKGVGFLKESGSEEFKRSRDELNFRKDYLKRLQNGAYDDQL